MTLWFLMTRQVLVLQGAGNDVTAQNVADGLALDFRQWTVRREMRF